MTLTHEEKNILLAAARSSIAGAVSGRREKPIESDSPSLNRLSGVFVTLHHGDDLRGCIGYVEPILPLIEATQDVAVKAAREDPRFDPVEAEELSALNIEISVLSPLSPLTDARAVEIGRHGLVIESGNRRGLLLPQVATEYGWDREQFLDHTAVKAGLSPDAWKRTTSRLFTFTVQKFSDSDRA